MFPRQSISDVYTGLMQAIGASQKVFEFIDRKPLVKPEGGSMRPNKLQGRIEFRNVSFAYPTRPDSLVLKVRSPPRMDEGNSCMSGLMGGTLFPQTHLCT